MITQFGYRERFQTEVGMIQLAIVCAALVPPTVGRVHIESERICLWLCSVYPITGSR